MKKLIICCLLIFTGCGINIYTSEKDYSVLSIYKSDNEKYKYLYKINEFSGGDIYYYSNQKFNIGDKLKLTINEK